MMKNLGFYVFGKKTCFGKFTTGHPILQGWAFQIYGGAGHRQHGMYFMSSKEKECHVLAW